MKRTAAIIALRTIATLAALLGVGSIYGLTNFVLAKDIDLSTSAKIAIAVPGIIFAVYFIWIAYLIWFRLSPLAIQQVCGLLGFVLLVTFNNLFAPSKAPNGLYWALAFLGLLVVVLVGYRILGRYLCKIVFQAGITVR